MSLAPSAHWRTGHVDDRGIRENRPSNRSLRLTSSWRTSAPAGAKWSERSGAPRGPTGCGHPQCGGRGGSGSRPRAGHGPSSVDRRTCCRAHPGSVAARRHRLGGMESLVAASSSRWQEPSRSRRRWSRPKRPEVPPQIAALRSTSLTSTKREGVEWRRRSPGGSRTLFNCVIEPGYRLRRIRAGLSAEGLAVCFGDDGQANGGSRGCTHVERPVDEPLELQAVGVGDEGGRGVAAHHRRRSGALSRSRDLARCRTA